MHYLIFLTGVAISATAAYYSIVGLTAIFSGAFWSVAIMGSVLELGKLVAVSWLYNNWNKAPFLIKAYFTTAIAALMLITSMGIFGFLSRAHIEQSVNLNSGVSEQVGVLDTRITSIQSNIRDIDTEIQQIDDSLKRLTASGQAKTALAAADKQRKTRDVLVQRKQAEMKTLGELQTQKIKINSEAKKLEAEVGPIKYVAEMIYGNSDHDIVDKAIRFVIMILIFVFDPLAVLLLIAFNISQKNRDNPEFLDMTEIKIKAPRKAKANTKPKIVATKPIKKARVNRSITLPI